MTIQRLLSLLYTVMIVATVVVAAFVLLLMRALTDANSSQEARHQSYLLADELRQSSDDLTRMARTYAVTGDPLYEEWYWEILAIRNGEEPRPEGYERIFWDLVTREGRKPRPNGEAVALRELMQRLGFTATELARLQEAQNNSDALVGTETIVMNAVKGLYDDGTGNFVVRGEPDMELARRLMHDSTYHADKARIMRPIDEFFQMMSARTEGQVGRDFGLARRLVATIVVLSASLIGLAVASLVVVDRRVGRPISLATASVKRLAADVGVGASTDPASRVPGVRDVLVPQDEIGQITGMFEALTEDLHAANADLESTAHQLAVSNKELEAFAYSVSHDLRGPLRAIDGFTGILTEEHADQLDAEGHRLLDIVSDSTGLMGQLIEDILELSRVGRSAIEPARIDMREAVAAAVRQVQQQHVRDLPIEVRDLPPAMGDERLIRQVWINLLSNAVKFTAERESPAIEVRGVVENNEHVYSVKDNGAGFDMRHCGKLFSLFERIHSREEFEGTGVGLAIVKRIVERHGGRVWSEGKVDEGATFYFALPKGGD